MSSRLKAEVVVIGGGPAGCVAALRLASLGHEVCLLERVGPGGSRSVGEAFSAGVVRQLEFLGLGGAVEAAGSLRFPGSEVRWGTERFEHRPTHPDALTVDRRAFDAALLEAVVRRGVRVLRPAAARGAGRTPTGWAVEARTPDGPLTLHAGFVIDASGRAGFLPRKRSRISPPTIALFAYWRAPNLPRIPRIDAGPREWYWGSPVPDGSYNAMVFLDRDDQRAESRSIESRYCDLIERSGLLAGCRARIDGSVRARDAGAYSDALSTGPGYLKIGEAAFAVDPLSSSGVQISIRTALVASVVTHTILTHPDRTDLALAFYRNDHAEIVARHSAWAAQNYRENTRHAGEAFWHSRATREDSRALRKSPQGPSALHREDRLVPCTQLAVRPMPCLVGDFVEVRSAVAHPSLDRPIVFLENANLAELMAEIRPGATVAEVTDAISRRIAQPEAERILMWLLERKLLQPLEKAHVPENATSVMGARVFR